MTARDVDELDRFLAGVERRALITAELWTQDREEALDLVQDAMLAFVDRYAHKPVADWPPLFHRILQNRIRDWGRRSRVRGRWRVWPRDTADGAGQTDALQNQPDPRASLPEDVIDREAAVTALVRYVAELPERQRQAVVLRVWEELDVAATASVMGCTAGSVKTHLSRGLARLRERLKVRQ